MMEGSLFSVLIFASNSAALIVSASPTAKGDEPAANARGKKHDIIENVTRILILSWQIFILELMYQLGCLQVSCPKALIASLNGLWTISCARVVGVSPLSASMYLAGSGSIPTTIKVFVAPDLLMAKLVLTKHLTLPAIILNQA